MKKIAIIAEYNPNFEPHTATEKALHHSAKKLNAAITPQWISTNTITQNLLNQFDGFLIAPGSPYKNLENTLLAINFARKNKIPLLGTCGGFQHIILEYARNVLNFKDAQHAEYNPEASNLFISELECSLAGKSIEVHITPESLAAQAYHQKTIKENYYCNFSINPQYLDLIKNGPMKITGFDKDAEVRIIEWPDHPFFMGTLFVPQTRSTQKTPHPLITSFVHAVVNKT